MGNKVEERLVSKFWTERGLVKLGRVVKLAREAKSWSLRDVEREIKKKNPSREDNPTYRTIENLEVAKGQPRWNTVVAIASLNLVLHPLTGKPFTEEELSDIAAERFDPETGRYTLGNQEPTIAALIKLELQNRFKPVEQLAVEKLAEVAHLNPERMMTLLEGERPTDKELAALAQMLTKDDGTLWKEDELRELRAIAFPAEVEQEG